jgi:hypothetical protein
VEVITNPSARYDAEESWYFKHHPKEGKNKDLTACSYQQNS